MTVLENVRSKLFRLQYRQGRWQKHIVQTPKRGTLRVISADPSSKNLLFTFEGFLTPPQMYWGLDTNLSAKLIASMPAQFSARGLYVKQRFARSKDGTLVPYSIISRKRLNRYGHNMALLYGYGGFEIPLTPRYSGGSW